MDNKEAIKKLIAIEVLTKNRWIPVSERLPETDGYYLVTKDISAVSKDIFEVDRIEYRKECDEYNNGFRSSFPIIAWKPLPKPYKENDK